MHGRHSGAFSSNNKCSNDGFHAVQLASNLYIPRYLPSTDNRYRVMCFISENGTASGKRVVANQAVMPVFSLPVIPTWLGTQKILH
ncbi:hypothetical protein TNCV_1389311 [Trichonephila clavipes]|nr:hypothetical protein TNCV_1389311 [Trichonephila clavipes]